MRVSTDVIDVLPDGTIARLVLKTDPMAVTICRNDPDQNYMIEKIDIVNQERMEEALKFLAAHLHRYCIYSIDIDCVGWKKDYTEYLRGATTWR